MQVGGTPLKSLPQFDRTDSWPFVDMIDMKNLNSMTSKYERGGLDRFQTLFDNQGDYPDRLDEPVALYVIDVQAMYGNLLSLTQMNKIAPNYLVKHMKKHKITMTFGFGTAAKVSLNGPKPGPVGVRFSGDTKSNTLYGNSLQVKRYYADMKDSRARFVITGMQLAQAFELVNAGILDYWITIMASEDPFFKYLAKNETGNIDVAELVDNDCKTFNILSEQNGLHSLSNIASDQIEAQMGTTDRRGSSVVMISRDCNNILKFRPENVDFSKVGYNQDGPRNKSDSPEYIRYVYNREVMVFAPMRTELTKMFRQLLRKTMRGDFFLLQFYNNANNYSEYHEKAASIQITDSSEGQLKEINLSSCMEQLYMYGDDGNVMSANAFGVRYNKQPVKKDGLFWDAKGTPKDRVHQYIKNKSASKFLDSSRALYSAVLRTMGLSDKDDLKVWSDFTHHVKKISKNYGEWKSVQAFVVANRVYLQGKKIEDGYIRSSDMFGILGNLKVLKRAAKDGEKGESGESFKKITSWIEHMEAVLPKVKSILGDSQIFTVTMKDTLPNPLDGMDELSKWMVNTYMYNPRYLQISTDALNLYIGETERNDQNAEGISDAVDNTDEGAWLDTYLTADAMTDIDLKKYGFRVKPTLTSGKMGFIYTIDVNTPYTKENMLFDTTGVNVDYWTEISLRVGVSSFGPITLAYLFARNTKKLITSFNINRIPPFFGIGIARGQCEYTTDTVYFCEDRGMSWERETCFREIDSWKSGPAKNYTVETSIAFGTHETYAEYNTARYPAAVVYNHIDGEVTKFDPLPSKGMETDSRNRSLPKMIAFFYDLTHEFSNFIDLSGTLIDGDDMSWSLPDFHEQNAIWGLAPTQKKDLFDVYRTTLSYKDDKANKNYICTSEPFRRFDVAKKKWVEVKPPKSRWPSCTEKFMDERYLSKERYVRY